MATAYRGIGNLDKARELYRKSERTYQLAYADIESDEFKQQYIRSLKIILQAHMNVAEQAGAVTEVEEIKKMLESLPQE
jgi:cob(I)alamin adenosyltransferase